MHADLKSAVFKYAAVPVRMNVKEGMTVSILTDTKIDPVIQEALMAAVKEQQATPVMITIAPLASFGNEPPEAAAAAILKTDFVITACSTAMTHTDAVRAALEKGIPMLAMGGITVDSLTQGASTADYDLVLKITEQIADMLENSSVIKVTSRNGTNVTFSVTGRPAIRISGYVDKISNIASFPGGEVATAPVEGTANGTIVVDGSMHHVGKIENPIVFTVKDGKVFKIEGKAEAEKLRRFLDANGDENSFNLAEFAFGTNPSARLTADSQESKRKLGTIHFAIGDNRTLGGHTYSKTHLDGLLLEPSVWIDGMMVLDNGKFALDIG